MGAKRILALGSVAALCAGAAAPLFMASAASADLNSARDAYSLCVDSTSTVVLGVDLSDLECTHLFGTNYVFAGVTGPTGAAGGTGGTGGLGLARPDGRAWRVASGWHGWHRWCRSRRALVRRV